MKIALQYVNDANGHTQAVQLPVAEWEKILTRLKKYEQTLQLKSDLKEALDQVKKIKGTKGKQSLNDFLNEAELGAQLTAHPDLGTPLGSNTYKIRIAIKSKGKGRSGGGRIITYVVTEHREVYLLTIYDNSEVDSINDKTIRFIITTLGQ